MQADIASLILNLSTRGRWVINFMTHPHKPQKKTLVPTQQEALWSSESVYIIWRKENGLPLWGYASQIIQPIV